MERLSWVVTVVGVPLAVFGALFASQQLAESRRALEASSDTAVHEAMDRVDTIFIENPELRPYFYDGKSVPGLDEPELRAKVLATAELMLDFFELARVTEEYYRVDEEAWKQYLSDMFTTSPALNYLLGEHCRWWPAELFGDYTPACRSS